MAVPAAAGADRHHAVRGGAGAARRRARRPGRLPGPARARAARGDRGHRPRWAEHKGGRRAARHSRGNGQDPGPAGPRTSPGGSGMSSWHLLDDDLGRYIAGTAPPPLLWSVEAHLLACGACRERLATSYSGTRDSWQRLDVALDEPRAGRVEALLVRLGVSDVTARLLAATWVLRASWLAAVVVTLALVAAITQLSPMFVA